MNKYRLSIMIILIIMLFLYMINILNISDETNFAFTFSALIFSVSSATDTFYNENKCEKIIRFILDTMAIGVAILLPNLSNTELIAKIMRVIDSNVLLLLALFFTMAGQWAIEIKLKDIGNNKEKEKSMRVTKQNNCELKISNTKINNMSNWQISNTINTLTTVNNKFDILDKLNTMFKNGYEKKDIFIMDKSFSFTNNYKTYFNKNIIMETSNAVDISKLSNMGKMVTMSYNYDVVCINSLFSLYKVLNSIINTNLKCRLKQKYLYKSYKVLFINGLDKAYKLLYEGTVEQVKEIYGQYKTIDNNKLNSLVEKIKGEYNKAVNKNISKYEKMGKESEQRFSYFFNSCSRPIIGVYNENNHSFEIINADHMYKNGEESPNQIRLKSITKNSPVVLALTVTGIMLSFVAYLAYRNHNVNIYVEEADDRDVPKNNSKIIENVLINDDGSIFTNEVEHSVGIPDKQIIVLTKDIYNKLDNITDNKRVHIELSIDTELII